jgi:hypothetical protein
LSRPRSVDVPDLLALLGSGDPMPAGALVERLGVTRPVLARLVAEAGARVIRIGKARATAYVASATTDAGSAWPLRRMRPDATLEELGTVHALRGERFLFAAIGDRPNLARAVDRMPGHFPGLPWFLDDLRPQGFLGRTLAHQRGRELDVPGDLARWRMRDFLVAITRTGGTSVGDLLLGQAAADTALSELHAPPDAVDIGQRMQRYPQWAQAALAGEDVGSSPGGEQPKFTATVRTPEGRYAAIVKFALPDGGRGAERWADLLACEHLALTCLRSAGLPAAESQLLHAQDGVFLEVRRFDRTADSLGRRGFVTLLALDAAFHGAGPRDWDIAADALLADGWIDTDTATAMARLHWFGCLIGNSDMHSGNLGFHLVDAGPLPLVPAYDMLPMSLAPSRTGALRPAMPIVPSTPGRAGQLAHVAWAADTATRFWQAVADSAHIRSDEMRRVAALNRDAIARFTKALGSA